MSEFEKSFKDMIFNAVDSAMQKYSEQISHQENYFTIAQFAEKLNVSTDKIRSWIDRKKNPLPAYRDSKRGIRIFESEFKIWYRQFKVNPGQKVEKLINLKKVQ